MIQALRRLDWKVFAILLAGGLLGVLAVLPFMGEVLAGLPVDVIGDRTMTMPAIVALALVQNGIVLTLAIVVGMVVSERIGLRTPLIRAWARGTRADDAGRLLVAGLLVGLVVGAVLVALDALVFLRHLPAPMQAMYEIPLWKRLLAGVAYGGITEELFMRLFLLAVVAWLLGRIWRSAEGRPSAAAFWTAIIFTSLLFGLGHLPVTSLLADLSVPIVARALVLNGVAGAAFGYLYWKRGLEAAMAAHIGAHLVMQGPGVFLLTRLH